MSGPDAVDTILAVSTPPGAGAVSVVRLSGPEAMACVARHCVAGACVPGACDDSGTELRSCSGFTSLQVTIDLGRLRLPVRIAVFRAPRSYTGEDLLEISLPGSTPLVSLLTRRLLTSGGLARGSIRWAGPGELTQRAFLNGRLDLTEAEGVAQLISATDEAEARASQRGLRGELGARIRGLRVGALECLALIEAALDFPDEELPQVSPGALLSRLAAVRSDLEALRASTALRAPSPTSLRIVLSGFPNAGKSSLFNALLGRPLALISAVPGTTRDPVRGVTLFEGRRLEWIDVAGTLDTESWTFGGESPEDAAIWSSVRRLTRLEVESSDAVVWVLDPTGDREASLGARDQLRTAAIITVIQKADLIEPNSREALAREAPDALWVSARDRTGLENLVKHAVRAVEQARGAGGQAAGREPPSFLVSAHQELALERAEEAFERARAGLASGLGFECVASDLRDAVASLDDLLGATPREAVLDWVFSRFCIGK